MAELWNDMVYTDVMQSDGYVVDYGVLTTYSLEMPSLLSVPFALGTMSELSDAAMHSPHLILEAVNQAAGKFAVFCNAGCIAVPQTHSRLYSLLEQSVVQIALPPKGAGFINFHPKVWVIKATNPDTGERLIKVVVLSRNITGSNDLDVVCELVGHMGTEPSSRRAKAKHRPLADFLTWLASKSPARIRRHMRSLIKDLDLVERFDLDGSPFDDYDFFPMGIDGYDGLRQCLRQEMLDHAADMVIISPFIDQKTLNMLTTRSHGTRKTLITRHASVTEDVLNLFQGNNSVYVPKEVLTDRVEKDVTVDLHEKVYFIRNQRTGFNYLYLGSTNATQNGFGRNVEFLLRLRFAPYKSSYDKFRGELIYDGKECMFEPVTSAPPPPGTVEDTSDELLLRQAIATIQKAEIQERHDDAYAVTIRCKRSKVPMDMVTLYPLGCEAMAATLADGMTFAPMGLAMLTEFYVLAAGDVRRVVKIETTGMPAGERDRAIFRSIIDTKGKFINYLAFMLTDDVEQYVIESQQMERELSGLTSTAKEQEISISLYEDMVRMAYTRPDRIAAIRSVMDKADPSVIPTHFAQLYTTFEQAIKQIRRL